MIPNKNRCRYCGAILSSVFSGRCIYCDCTEVEYEQERRDYRRQRNEARKEKRQFDDD